MRVISPTKNAVAPTVPIRAYIAFENRGKLAANVVRNDRVPYQSSRRHQAICGHEIGEGARVDEADPHAERY